MLIFDNINNMSNLTNLNNSNSMTSLGNDLKNLNDMGIGMSNISNRKIGNLGNGIRNRMANVGGMYGVKEEKSTQNVLGNHYNLYSTNYFDLFKTEGSTPFANTVTCGGYHGNNTFLHGMENVVNISVAKCNASGQYGLNYAPLTVKIGYFICLGLSCFWAILLTGSAHVISYIWTKGTVKLASNKIYGIAFWSFFQYIINLLEHYIAHLDSKKYQQDLLFDHIMLCIYHCC